MKKYVILVLLVSLMIFTSLNMFDALFNDEKLSRFILLLLIFLFILFKSYQTRFNIIITAFIRAFTFYNINIFSIYQKSIRHLLYDIIFNEKYKFFKTNKIMEIKEKFIEFYNELPDLLRDWAIANYDENFKYFKQCPDSLYWALCNGWNWRDSENGDYRLWSQVVNISLFKSKKDRDVAYGQAISDYFNRTNKINNMNNKQEIQSQIDKLKKQQLEQDQLIKELEEKLRHADSAEDLIESKCSDKSCYYYIESRMSYGFLVDREDINITGRPSILKFYNKEHAELMKEKMLLMQEMYAYAHYLNSKHIESPVYQSGTFGIRLCSISDISKLRDKFKERVNKYYHKQY